jgi:hypothetical protein
MSDPINPRVLEAVKKLSPKEQDLLARVLKIEREKLYLERPRVKEDLLRAVREVFK